MKEQTEAKIQQMCFVWYHNTYCLEHHSPSHCLFSVPNDSSSKEETMRKLATGMIAGVSDMVMIEPNRVVFIEVKTPIGKQSDNQIKFQKKVEALGFEYWLIRSLEEFKEKLLCSN